MRGVFSAQDSNQEGIQRLLGTVSKTMVSFEDELEPPGAGLPLGPRLGVTADTGQSFLGRFPPPLFSVFSSMLVGRGTVLVRYLVLPHLELNSPESCVTDDALFCTLLPRIGAAHAPV